ncbi:WavE lipopolysaccharide synthesis family protein [Corallincola spongiicola]|uniref:LPS biosynthesis protein WavE n=1 Tax=Corallincola spongiicola TaxID=2520508 RepID=A0ABY1WPJ6_9GAMM|nr:WavE lipopolysaccharide synthesis family protein [Corallincola spongiicola]TAA46008.1 LPS biosynthesis protein WavE [Corallincola spongiicola]
MTIANQDITVVVQGPVQASPDRNMDEGITVRSLASVRKHLPGAHILLSTWKGQPTEGLDFDELLLNDDPGPNINRYRADGSADKTNNNRQLVSTLNGLKQVKTRYAMKLRSDNFLTSDACKKLQQKFPKRADECCFLKERVVVNNTFTRDYAKGLPVVFHACDFFYFGLTEDLLALWDIPWFDDLPYDESRKGQEQHDGYPYFMPDCTQKFWLKALQRFDPSIQIKHLHDYSPKSKRQSDLCYANNLIIGEPEVVGLGLNTKFSGSERANRIGSIITYIHHLAWQRLYKKYCDPSHHIPGNTADWIRTKCLRGALLSSKWLEGKWRLKKKLNNAK